MTLEVHGAHAREIRGLGPTLTILGGGRSGRLFCGAVNGWRGSPLASGSCSSGTVGSKQTASVRGAQPTAGSHYPGMSGRMRPGVLFEQVLITRAAGPWSPGCFSSKNRVPWCPCHRCLRRSWFGFLAGSAPSSPPAPCQKWPSHRAPAAEELPCGHYIKPLSAPTL